MRVSVEVMVADEGDALVGRELLRARMDGEALQGFLEAVKELAQAHGSLLDEGEPWGST